VAGLTLTYPTVTSFIIAGFFLYINMHVYRTILNEHSPSIGHLYRGVKGYFTILTQFGQLFKNIA